MQMKSSWKICWDHKKQLNWQWDDNIWPPFDVISTIVHPEMWQQLNHKLFLSSEEKKLAEFDWIKYFLGKGKKLFGGYSNQMGSSWIKMWINLWNRMSRIITPHTLGKKFWLTFLIFIWISAIILCFMTNIYISRVSSVLRVWTFAND